MVEMIVNEVSAKYLEELQRHDDPEKRFEEGIDFLFNPVMINDEYASFFYDCWAEAKRNPRIRESFKMLYTRFRKAIIDLLAQNKGAAGLSSAKIQELADMIMAIQDGISLQWEMLPNGVSLKKAASMTKQMIRLYIREENRSR
jgi:hypothetical protein